MWLSVPQTLLTVCFNLVQGNLQCPLGIFSGTSSAPVVGSTLSAQELTARPLLATGKLLERTGKWCMILALSGWRGPWCFMLARHPRVQELTGSCMNIGSWKAKYLKLVIDWYAVFALVSPSILYAMGFFLQNARLRIRLIDYYPGKLFSVAYGVVWEMNKTHCHMHNHQRDHLFNVETTRPTTPT